MRLPYRNQKGKGPLFVFVFVLREDLRWTLTMLCWDHRWVSPRGLLESQLAEGKVLTCHVRSRQATRASKQDLVSLALEQEGSYQPPMLAPRSVCWHPGPGSSPQREPQKVSIAEPVQWLLLKLPV